MKKPIIGLALVLLLSLVVVAGCGGGSDNNQAETTKAAETPAADAAPAAETPAAGEAELASHDCDGGCGMKDVAMENLTEIDGKYYCAGCAKHMKEDDHTGHNH